MTRKIVYLEWSDAVANSNWAETKTAEHWADESNFFVQTIGWIIKETKNYICIAASWKEEDDLCDEKFASLQKIPIGWIKKRIDLTKYIQ